jgi:hypothetical protein
MRTTQLLPLVLIGIAVSSQNPDAAGLRPTIDVARAPIVQERHYVLNARVRPLLFWIRKNDVGEARVRWRRAATGGYGYELLIGSDPLKAPRQINKWGYIAEDVSGSDATIVGVMKPTKDASVKEAEADVATEGQGGYQFDTIRARIAASELTSGTVRVQTPTDLTLRDLDALLSRTAVVPMTPRRFVVPADTAPGFLTALAGLINDTVSSASVADSPRPPKARAYIYNGFVYDLSLPSIKVRADFVANGRHFGPAVDADFTITNRATGEITKFSITYGRTGAIAAVPLKVVFRPKWWFEAELVLGEPQ